jgi:hypothetical protein
MLQNKYKVRPKNYFVESHASPGLYCAVIFFNDSVRMLASCLKSISDNDLKIIAVDGAFKEYMKANNIYRDSSHDGCLEIAHKMATHLIPAKRGGWDDEVEKRNAYLSLVPTGQYCMWLDTDEVLPKFTLGELTADCYRMIEVLHDEDGQKKEFGRLRIVKKYDDLVYKYQHCRMYRLGQHFARDLSSGCVVRSSGSTNNRHPFLMDTAGKQIKFEHFPFRRAKMKQEEKERFYKIRAEQQYPY